MVLCGNVKKYSLIVVLWLCIPPLAFSQAIYYDADNRLLSVETGGRLLSAVLTEISRETGIDIFMNPAVDKKVFVTVRRQPLEQAIKRIIKPLNNILVYEGDAVVAVKIFEKSFAEATLKVASNVEEGNVSSSPAVEDTPDEEIEKTETRESSVAEKRKQLLRLPQFRQALEEDSAAPMPPGQRERPEVIPPHLLYGPSLDEKAAPSVEEENPVDNPADPMAAQQGRGK